MKGQVVDAWLEAVGNEMPVFVKQCCSTTLGRMLTKMHTSSLMVSTISRGWCSQRWHLPIGQVRVRIKKSIDLGQVG